MCKQVVMVMSINVWLGARGGVPPYGHDRETSRSMKLKKKISSHLWTIRLKKKGCYTASFWLGWKYPLQCHFTCLLCFLNHPSPPAILYIRTGNFCRWTDHRTRGAVGSQCVGRSMTMLGFQAPMEHRPLDPPNTIPPPTPPTTQQDFFLLRSYTLTGFRFLWSSRARPIFASNTSC